MAVIAVLVGGVLGFFCAVLGNITLSLGWLSTLTLWWSAGSLIAILFVVALLLPRNAKPASLANEQA